MESKKAFHKKEIEELEKAAADLLKEGISISEKLKKQIQTIRGIVYDVPHDVVETEIISWIEAVKKELHTEELKKEQNRVKKQLKRASKNTMAFDSRSAKTASDTAAQVKRLEKQVQEYGNLFTNGRIQMSFKEFLTALNKIDGEVGRIEDALEKCRKQASGLKDAAGQYSPDPVHMGTGNFTYERKDLSFGGAEGLEFVRTYNALELESGAMGEGWRHSFEITLETADDGEKKLVEGDGHAEYFRPAGEGFYRSMSGTGKKLRKTPDGYEIQTEQCGIWSFHETGMLHKIKDPNGWETIFSYENGSLNKVESVSGHMQFFYNQNGYLSRVRDHMGRSFHYEYEDGKLAEARDPQGHRYCYRYDEQGTLCTVANPRGIETVKNTFDQSGRPVRQQFPDGGEMRYEYDDKEKKIILTQQNGYSTVYVHNDRYCNTEILYPDGSREKHEFDQKRRMLSYTDGNGHKTSYCYDSRGNLIEETDPAGNRTSIRYNLKNRPEEVLFNGRCRMKNQYDKRGNLISSEDAVQRRTTVSYTSQGLPEKVIQADGSCIRLTYDEKRNIILIRDPHGAAVQYAYDAAGRVISRKDPCGKETLYTYDPMDRIRTITDALGNVKTYSYNESGKVTEIQDFDGNSVHISYNCLNKPEKVIDPEGGITRYEYDKMWNLSKVTDADGYETVYQYDCRNRLGSVRDANGGNWEFQYDPAGNVIKTTDPNGEATVFAYDALNRRTQMTEADGSTTRYEYNDMGQTTKITDPAGGEYHFSYDEAGQLIWKKDPAGMETVYTYTPLGQIRTVKEGRAETRYEYGPGGRLLCVTAPAGAKVFYTYDAAGRVVKEENQLGNANLYDYDCLGRVVRITNAAGGVRSYAYDAIGNVKTMTDEAGNTTRYDYSPNGNLRKATDPQGNETKYAYDQRGRLTAIEQIGQTDVQLKTAEGLNAAVLESRKTVYERDGLGNITKTIDPLHHVETYLYDRKGNLTAKMDADGYRTDYTYDAVDNLTGVCYGDGKKVSFAYDPLKELKEIRDWLGTTAIETDAAGRAVSVEDYRGKRIGYQWSPEGQRQKTVYPDGKEAVFQYNDAGQMTEARFGDYEAQYRYDELGRLKERTAGGTSSSYTYQSLGRVETLLHRGADFEKEYRFAYDAAGRKIQKIEKSNGQQTVYAYAYDTLSRLTGVQKNGKDIQKFAYDGFGNRIREWNRGQEISYHYNARDQLLKRILPDLEETYEYDRRGNMTGISEKGSGKQKMFFYDSTNRMTGAVNYQTGKSVHYLYNGLGERAGQKVYSQALDEEFFGNPVKCIERELVPEKKILNILDLTKDYHNLLEKETNGNRQRFLWDGCVLGMEEEQRMQTYLQDDLGSVTGITDMQGRLQDAFAYDVFGRAEGRCGTVFGFTGYMMEPVTGLYDAQARYYDPIAGRFVSDDNIKGFIEYPVMLNEYSYCVNEPNDYVDLDGNIAVAVVIGIAAFTGGLVSGGIEAYREKKKTGKINIRKVLIEGTKGAIVSGVGAAGVGVGTVAVVSGAASAGVDIANDIANREKINWRKALFDGVVDGTVSFGAGKVSKFVGDKVKFSEFLKKFAYSDNKVISNIARKFYLGKTITMEEWKQFDAFAEEYALGEKELKYLLLQYAGKTFGKDVVSELKGMTYKEMVDWLKNGGKAMYCID